MGNQKLILQAENMQKRIGELANAINALENQVIILQQENKQLKEDVACASRTILDIHEPIEHSASKPRKLIADPAYDIKKVYAMMENRAPRTFGIYKELMKNGSDTYEQEGSPGCSAEGDVKSIHFSKFVRRYIHGNVLDIGCGPIELPIYLKGYPLECIYGLDPLLPYKEHPFSFVRGVAEAIPWEAKAFDTVVFATSFDHVFLVDVVMEEVERVLADDGYLLIWIGLAEEAKPYNPYASDFEPADKYHMFHNTKQNFEELMETRFEIIECYYYRWDATSHFYALRKKGGSHEIGNRTKNMEE